MQKINISDELNFYKTKKILESMYLEKLINKKEYQQVYEKLIEKYKPYLWELMPINVDIC